MLTLEIFSLDDNYQEVVIIQWYYSYHPVLSFDVWLHWNRIIYIMHTLYYYMHIYIYYMQYYYCLLTYAI